MSGPSARLESLFVTALEQDSHAARAEFLERVCAGDPALRRRVEALLKAHEDAGQFLEAPPWLAGTDPSGAGPRVETGGPTGAADRSGSPLLAGLPPGLLTPALDPGGAAMFGPYEVMAVIGRGGMGVVLQARDPRLDRVVALKVLGPGLAGHATARQRFLREARTAAAVRHDHIVTIHAIEEIAGLPTIVMEHVEGLSLQAEIDEHGPLEADEIVRIGRQIALGLHAAHSQGLVHRDIKPDNILLERGTRRVKITDFGLARLVDDTGLTHPGLVTGTPQYMSPEQAHGQRLDARSDLFSLGGVLYAMCAGHSPFRAETIPAVIRRVCEDRPQPLREVRPDLPGWLADIILRLLEKSPDRRFASAADVEEHLRTAAEGRPMAMAPHPTRRPPRGAGRRWWMPAVCAAGIAAAALAAVWRPSGRPVPVDSAAIVEVARPGRSASSSVTPAPLLVSPPATANGPSDRRSDAPPEQPEAQQWLPAPGEARRLHTDGDVSALAVAPEGDTLYAAGPAGLIHAWNMRTGGPLAPFRGHDGAVNDLAVMADGGRLISCGADGTLRIWDVPTRSQRVSLRFGVPARRLAGSPDGTRIATLFGIDAGRIVLFDAEHGYQQRSCSAAAGCWFESAAWSPDGTRIAAGVNDGSIVLFDVESGKPLRTLAADRPGPIHGLQFSQDGARLYSCDAAGRVICRRVTDGARIVERRLTRGMTDLAVSSDETWLAVAGSERVRLWDLTHPLSLRDGGWSELSLHDSPVRRLVFLPGGRHLASCGTEGTILIEGLTLPDAVRGEVRGPAD